MKIYKILKNGYFGGIEIIPDNRKGIPLYYTRTAPPEISEGMYAKWVGYQWKITDQPPPVPKPMVPLIDSNLLDFDSASIIDSDGLLIDSNMDSN